MNTSDILEKEKHKKNPYIISNDDSDKQLYTKEDMRKAFEAGENYTEDSQLTISDMLIAFYIHMKDVYEMDDDNELEPFVKNWVKNNL